MPTVGEGEACSATVIKRPVSDPYSLYREAMEG